MLSYQAHDSFLGETDRQNILPRERETEREEFYKRDKEPIVKIIIPSS